VEHLYKTLHTAYKRLCAGKLRGFFWGEEGTEFFNWNGSNCSQEILWDEAHGKNKSCPLSPLFLSYIFILSLPTINIISAYLE
jgi:hypothetical protein